MPHLHDNDAKKELLSIFGILAATAGLLLALLLGYITRPLPDAPRATVLFVIATVLTVAGAWLIVRRRWAGLLLAATSLATAAGYVMMLTRCQDCSAGVLLANIAIAVMCGTPGVLIIRWRRFLR